MNCVGIHFCGDELFLVVLMFPFVSIYAQRVLFWWNSRRTSRFIPRLAWHKMCECQTHASSEKGGRRAHRIR